ncbi:MAG: glycosyl hydrolase, partial [Planctomycetota bacterium]
MRIDPLRPICLVLIVFVALGFQRTSFSLAETTVEHAKQLAKTLKLRSLGPAFKPARVAEIAVDPNNRSTWYVAHGSSGLWKTTNAGITWKPIFDDGGSYSLGYVLVDPKDSNTVWLGTGENISNRSVGFGDGVYKSEDAGESWTRVGLIDSQHIGKIVIDPRDSDVVFVAAEGPLWSAGGERGVYRTADGGKSWEAILQISDDTGVTDLVMDPHDPDVLYASSYQRRRRVGQLIGGGPESVIYKTSDGGETWEKLTEGIPTVDKGRIALTVSPQKQGVVYALVTAAGEESGFFRSENGGESWTRQSDYKVIDPQYYGEIYADPHQFDRIWTVDVFIHLSEDGGKSFKRQRWDMHVDNHAIVLDPDDPKHMLVGNDGGVYESFDQGANWRHFTNLPTSQLYRVAIDNAEPFYNVYGGTQDNGSMFGPSRTWNRAGIRTSDWGRTRGGDGFQTCVDPEEPHIRYTLSQNGDLARSDTRTGQTKNIRPRLPDDESPVRWHWDAPLMLSPHSAQRVYFAGNRLFRSNNGGESWEALGGDLTRDLDGDALPIMGKVWGEDAVQKDRFTTTLSVITALDESPLKEGLLFVGTDDGLVQISEDGGENWRRIESFPGVPVGSYVSDISASEHDAQTVFVAINNYQRGDYKPYLLKSSDLGKTWTSIATSLPTRDFVWCVVEDLVRKDLLFAGTEFGLFFSVDAGDQWIPLENGVPTIPFRDIVIHPSEHDLVAATFGRGFYILDDLSSIRQLRNEGQIDEGYLIAPRDTWVYPENGFVEEVAGNFATPNSVFGCRLTYYLPEALPAGNETRIMLSIESATGSVVRKLPGPTKEGFQKLQWDLRTVAQDTSDRRRRIGPLVEPGVYTLKLVRIIDGKESILG